MEEIKSIESISEREKLIERFLEKLPEILNNTSNSDVNTNVSLRVFENEYLDLVKKNYSSSYYRSVRISFDHLHSYFKPQKPMPSFKQKEIEQFISNLKVNVPKGYRVYYRNLKAAFAKAHEWEYISVNYFKSFRLPKAQVLVPAFINNEQLSAIGNYINNQTVKDGVVFAFYTGLRLDEVMNVKWSGIDYEKKIITVGDNEFVTKGKKQRFIPMCIEVYELLKKREPSNVKNPGNSQLIFTLTKPNKKSGELYNNTSRDFVFCKENGFKYSKDYVSKMFKEACKKASINKSIHFHSLRHSFASYLVQQGVSLPTIKDLLGHTSITTTEIYSHLNVTTLEEAIKKFDNVNDTECFGQANSLKNLKEANSKISEYKTDGLKIYKLQSGELSDESFRNS
ncbi:MAG: site-specific integrase [Melioribacteraceae bacterium]